MVKKKKTIIEKLKLKSAKPKRILRKMQPIAKILEYEAPSVLNDPNRFFTGVYEQEKRLFFK